jgi:hypothetical protein
MAIDTIEPVQAAIILPEPIKKRLDQLVQLRIGESRESLVNDALDEFLIVTERRLERKKRTLALQTAIQPGTSEWEAAFQRLEQNVGKAGALTDEEMDDLVSEALSETRRDTQNR